MEKFPRIEKLGLRMSTFLFLTHGSRNLHHKLEGTSGYGDLTPSQFYSLMILDDFKSLPLSKISEWIRRSPGNMTLVIDNLEKEGFVERQRSTKDRRVILIALTELGQEKITAAKKAHEAAIEKEMAIYTTEELQILHDLLLRIQPQRPPSIDDNGED